MKRLILAAALALATAGAPPADAGRPAPARVDPRAPAYRWPALDRDEDGVFDRVDRCVGTPRGCFVDDHGCETDADGDGVCDGLDRCPDTPRGARVDTSGCDERAAARSKELKSRPAPETPPMSELERTLLETGRLRLEGVHFETASAKVLAESEAPLREAGELLEKHPALRVEVQGHTDTRGAARYNLRLSQARAEAVREFLLVHFQLDPRHLDARGYGESRPETLERNEEELLRNRRVVLRVLNPESLPPAGARDRASPNGR